MAREPRQKRGLTVEVRNNDINRLMQDENIFNEMRERKHFTKPSEKRARAKAAGRARWMKKKRELDNQ